ncbi:MAG: type IV pilus assembly protein PilY1 [Alphaproteobacteria bacterium]|jgi:type IV pilus assembly protein PilY1
MFLKKLGLSFSACLFSFMISFSALGDDLDIYLGSSSSVVTYKPNVLFIMDTSGSMSARDSTTTTRMQKVQDALREALGNATNINAGLMRFSDYGGPILYPIRDIDSSVSPELILPVTSNQDDAQQVDGNVQLSATRLVLSQDTSTVYSGFRYQDVNIPRGAVITSAILRFTSAGFNNAITNFTIAGEATGNANEFSVLANDISDRTTTVNDVVWDTDNEWPSTGETINTPDITPVIQEIINRSDWCGGNDLAVIMETIDMSAGSNRRSYASDDGSSRSPQLVITYDESTANGCIRDSLIYQVDEQDNNGEERYDGRASTGGELSFSSNSNRYTAARFKNLNIPQGSTVINAYLEFTAYRNGLSSGARMTIRGANQNSPGDFSPHHRYELRDIPKTSASVNWADMPPFYRNGVYQSPAVTDIVQEIVNRTGWNPGNEMMLIMSDFGSSRRGAFTYNGRASAATRLVIEFEGNATPGTTSTVRQHLIGKVDDLGTSGYTPIVDTLYEASLYFGGLDVDYGRQRGESNVSSSVRRNTRVSHRSSYVGGDPIRPFGCNEDNLDGWNCRGEYIPLGATYISPIEDLTCQTNNHIVLLSDGQANNNHSVEKIEAIIGRECTGSGGEMCGLDLARNISDSGDSFIDTRIVTHTIGFAADATANSFLNQISLQSGGGFYQADDSERLLEAFQTILRQVKDINSTFVSPGVAVNQLNRLSHRDELYFALFKPAEGTLWPGNLKKYRIEGDQILDSNGINAVNSSTGFFAENSHSYWSTLADGNEVRDGGAASKVDLVRDLYYFEDTPGSIFTSANVLDESNTNISTTDLAINTMPDSEALRIEVLKWARGVDVRDDDGDGSTTDVRMQMGDPIHSQPVIVNYSSTDSAVFVATNHGFLHSIDAEDGSENFAIAPKELLSNLHDFYQDTSTFNHKYGLDGDLVIRYVDDKVYLYLGMRRGGNNYYAFDVTSKTDPQLVFSINGGEGEYANLGQTWSRPIITKVQIGNVIKDVMIVGGGYDDSQDDKVVRSYDSVGNSVFIIDADDGTLLWSASDADADLVLDDMKYSIPARISAVDRDKDGLADHLYVADMGGQVFRLDINNAGVGPSELVKGGLLGTFAGDTAEDNRRFYYGPDVSEILLGEEQYYAVAIGSGFRAGPLDTTINDQFYLIKDTGVFNTDDDGEFLLPTVAFTEESLYDATDHLLTSTDEAERELASAAFLDKSGWRIRLTSGGEKVLSSPLILDYKVFFTTYLPASASDSLCAPPTGNSRAYLVSMVNGNAVADLNQNDEKEPQDRYAQLAQTGIAPDTKILIENIAQPVVCLGAECVAAVIEIDENGNEVACGSQFECLAQNIYGRFERVQKDIWKTEIEKP